MCAEIAQVILRYVYLSYRPGRKKQTTEQKTTNHPNNTKQNPTRNPKPNNRKGQTSWQHATQVGHAKVRREKKSETWGNELAKGLSVLQDNPTSKASVAECYGAVALLT